MAGDLSSYGLRYSNTSTRGHNFKLFVEHSNVEARRFYFGNRIVKPWNLLPVEIVNAPSAAAFKSGLRNCDLSKFLSLIVNTI